MFGLLLRTLAARRWLLLACAAFVLSSVGSGLTFIVVFGELLRLKAPASSLVVTYVLSATPSFVGSMVGERLCGKTSLFRILIGGEMLGLFGLLLPLLGIQQHSILLLQLAQCSASFAAGMTLPAMELVFKRGLPEAELPVMSAIETIVFGSNTLVGVGLGALLYGKMSSLAFVAADALSYALAAVLLWHAWRRYRDAGVSSDSQAPAPVLWAQLASSQRHAMLTLPLLALVGAPAVALLPALAPRIEQGGEGLIALPLLFARSLGQLLGPFMLPAHRFAALSTDSRMLVLPLCGFLACYLMLSQVGEVWLALTLVFVAHLLSNVVFSLGWYAITARFDVQQVAAASAASYRWQAALASLAALAAGLLVDHINATLTVIILSGAGLATAAVAWYLCRPVLAAEADH